MNIADFYRELDPATKARAAAAIVVLLLLALLYSALVDSISSLGKKRTSREAALAEMMLLNQRYSLASSDAQRLNNRLSSVKPDDSPAKMIDEIGIKGKGTQIKTLKGEDRPGAVEDAAEIRIEGISVNEAVNLIHRLEKGARPVIIKKANLKTRYDDPARIDLTLTMALLKPRLQERR